MFVLITQQLAL